jgi:hypothetical protein
MHPRAASLDALLVEVDDEIADRDNRLRKASGAADYRWVFTSSWIGEAALPDPSIDTNVTLKFVQLDGSYAHFNASGGAKNSKWAPPAPTQPLENLRQSKLAQLSLADAVAASACVPAIFTPLSIHDLYWNSSQEEIVVELVDGGVFDNQGLDALFETNCTQ